MEAPYRDLDDVRAARLRDLNDVRARLGRFAALITGILDTHGGVLQQQQIKDLIDGLARVEEKQLIELGEKDNVCPICFVPYLAILAEEEMAHAMDSAAHPIEELGVTKLAQAWQCGHMFCRRDISKWINGGNDSCPMCRRLLVERAANEPPTETPPPATTATSTTAEPTDPAQQEQQPHPAQTDSDLEGAQEWRVHTNGLFMEALRAAQEGRSETEEGAPTAQASDEDEGDPLAALLRQFTGAGLFRPAARQADAAEDEDREAYSGMYS